MKPEKLKAETLVMGIRDIRAIRGKNGSGVWEITEQG